MKLLSLTLVSVVLSISSATAQAAAELISRASYSKDAVRLSVELYYDKAAKRPDVWFEYRDAKVNYKATSLKDREKEADIFLKSSPITKLDNAILVIYEGFEKGTGDFDPSRGLSLIFHCPASRLPKETMEYFAKNFPSAIVKGSETYVKAVVSRVTDTQILPVAALDRDLSPELAPVAKKAL